MKCPQCGSLNDKVIESRTREDGLLIRRRRECLDCGTRFTSYEKVEERPIMVEKRDGSFEQFDISKVERGIHICTDKRRIDPETLTKLVLDIEDGIVRQAGAARRITSQAIGEEALKQLYKVDTVAYVRFASVYRQFSDVKQFIQEIERLADETED